MFKNMKIGMRLGLSFGLVLVLLSVIAFIGITRLAALNESIDKIANDRYPKTVMANEVLKQINRIALVGVAHLFNVNRCIFPKIANHTLSQQRHPRGFHHHTHRPGKDPRPAGHRPGAGGQARRRADRGGLSQWREGLLWPRHLRPAPDNVVRQ